MSSHTQLLDHLQVAGATVQRFYLGIGWSIDDCVSMSAIKNAPYERDLAGIVELCKSLALQKEGKPGVMEALTHLARDLDQRGASADVFRQALPAWYLSQSADAYFHVGRALVREGSKSEAIAMLRQAILIDPAHGAARRELGLVLRRQGQLQEAVTHFEIASALRRRTWFHTGGELDIPLLVAQPSIGVEIYFFGREYYVYRRRPNSVGVKAIAGTLFEVEESATYRFVRTLMRVQWVRRLFRWLATRRFVPRAGTQTMTSHGGGLLGRASDLARDKMRKFAQIGGNFFGRQINRRASTFPAAMDLAANVVFLERSHAG